jgi:hypothetical protein
VGSHFCKQSAVNRRVDLETLSIEGRQCEVQGFENTLDISAVIHGVLLTFYQRVYVALLKFHNQLNSNQNSKERAKRNDPRATIYFA